MFGRVWRIGKRLEVRARLLGEMLERTDVRCYRVTMARSAAFWTALAERSGDIAFERAMAIG